MSQTESGNDLLMLKRWFKVSSNLRTGADVWGWEQSWEDEKQWLCVTCYVFMSGEGSLLRWVDGKTALSYDSVMAGNSPSLLSSRKWSIQAFSNRVTSDKHAGDGDLSAYVCIQWHTHTDNPLAINANPNPFFTCSWEFNLKSQHFFLSYIQYIFKKEIQ